MLETLFALLFVVSDQNEILNSKIIKDTLNTADTFEFYSLEPSKISINDEKFHGWVILGKVIIKDDDKKLIIDSLYKSIEDSDGVSARCFSPRHGIRAKKGDEIIDILVCFECYKILIIKDKQNNKETITASAEKSFNKILKKYDIPLAEPKK